MSKKSQPKQDRQARLAQIQKEQKRQERKRNLLIYGATGAVAVLIIAATTYGLLTTSGARELDGLIKYDDLSQNHVAGKVDYPDQDQRPPAGGEHNAAWQNCGVYTEPLANEHAVHSLEHGAVWISYAPDLDEGAVEDVEAKLGSTGYVLVSPYEGQETPVMLTAWGVQLEVDDIGDEQVDAFLTEYVQGEQTPEPGAVCTGGIDATGAEADAALAATGP